MAKKRQVSSGVPQLDALLDGLYIGDNVVWHDDAGSLAAVFCLNFIRSSQAHKKPFVYVTFDRSPRNLLDKLGPFGADPRMTILDCFTQGKGAGSGVFTKFYRSRRSKNGCEVLQVENPRDPENLMEALSAVHGSMKGDVRYVFESITGMQELWGGEDQVISFYSHSCPRLYELNTIAYWILEKRAHSPRLRAQINQIAQVAIDMHVKRGTTTLSILKAENRGLETLNKPHRYWSKNLTVTFDPERGTTGRLDLGMRLKTFRTKRGFSQKDLAKLVGVTPSTISQIESNLIYPSLPALLKISEVLSVQAGAFLESDGDIQGRVVFPGSEAVETNIYDLPEGAVKARHLTPLDYKSKGEPYLIEIPPRQDISSHFLTHKGEEMGYVLEGRVQLKTKNGLHTAESGDLICLTTEIPLQWKNTGKGTARLLWIKIR